MKHEHREALVIEVDGIFQIKQCTDCDYQPYQVWLAGKITSFHATLWKARLALPKAWRELNHQRGESEEEGRSEPITV